MKKNFRLTIFIAYKKGNFAFVCEGTDLPVGGGGGVGGQVCCEGKGLIC